MPVTTGWSRTLMRPLRRQQLWSIVCVVAISALAPAHAFATVYRVGPNEALKTPSQAARIVQSGDTVQIEPMPGGYYDCAIWQADDLTIEGIGSDVRLTDRTCDGKAIFVTVGSRITVRNITFARARVPDGNGAGIRAEGADLRIEDSRFIDNESGILAASLPDSSITIRSSHFVDNGICRSGHCAAAIAVDHIARLSVLNCTISDTKGGDAISTLAAHTELIDNHIEDGANGTAAYLVELPAGGSLEMNNNVLERGPLPSASSIAVRVMEGVGANAVETLSFSGNTLKNDTHRSLTFVLNWTGTTARMQSNHLPQDATPVSSSGYLWFLTKSSIHRSLTAAKELARAVHHHL